MSIQTNTYPIQISPNFKEKQSSECFNIHKLNL